MNVKPTVVNNYTGQGFKYEKLLAVTSVLLSIVASALLINLTILQRKQTHMELEALKKNPKPKSPTT